MDIGSDPFFLNIDRKRTNEAVFSTKGFSFIYSDRYMEISTSLSSKHIFGIGESNKFFMLKPGTYTIWTKDFPFEIAWGRPGFNTYGHHPIFLCREKSDKFHLVYFRNSNAMDLIIGEETSGD